MRAKSFLVFSLLLLALVATVSAGPAPQIFIPLTPCRVVDTRAGFGGVMQSGVKRNFTITGGVTVTGFPTCTVPASARAVALNLTAVGPTADGFLAAWPSSAATFGASTLNVQAGQGALANGAIVALNTVEPSLSVIYGTAVSGTTHIVIDITGYFCDPVAPLTATGGAGWFGTLGFSEGASHFGVYGAGPYGVRGDGTQIGVLGFGSGTGAAVFGQGLWLGVEGDSANGSGVRGSGILYGVVGNATQFGLRGTSSLASSNYGDTFVGGAGVYGDSSASVGVYGTSDSNVGVAGVSKTNYGIYGAGGAYAGYFDGNVHINGGLTIAGSLSKGAGSFKIDHPLDPENKFLYHSFVESPDMKDVYDGVVSLDRQGHAVVELPEWFEALNSDYRYQLTCIGGFAPVYVSKEIADNRFEIAGGHPGLRVSWLVTGTRHDPYAEHHRIPVEEDKAPDERGRYLDPIDYGQPAEKAIGTKVTTPAVRPPG